MSIRSFTFVRSMSILLASLTTSLALSQSFNIDMDVFAGPEEGGNGAPSSGFGAAAGQQGFWNRIDAASHTRPWSLRGLDGNTTSVAMRWNVSGGGAGSGWIGNTGEYRRLLNDCTVITVPTTFVFSGLQPGRYRVFTYAIDRSGNSYPTRITIPEAIVPTQVSGAGAMPGNAFLLGVTHCIHEVSVTGSSFQLVAQSVLNGPSFGAINGFQIERQAVPEPYQSFPLVFGYFLLLIKIRGAGRVSSRHLPLQESRNAK